MRRSKDKKTGKTIVSAVLICLVIGIAYCWSIFEKALVQDNGWSNTQASLPYSVFMLCYAASMLMGGYLQNRLGVRRTCMLGGAVLTAGLLCLAIFLPSVGGLVLGFGVLAGIGQATCYSCVISTPLKWVSEKRRGLVTGITTGAVAFSSIYMTPVITAVIGRSGVRFGFLTMLAIVAPAVLVFSHGVESPQEDGLGTKERKGPSVREILSARPVYLIFFLSFSCSLYGQIIVGHIANIAYVQAGIENGAFFVVLLSACNCLGRFLCGMLSDHVPGPRLLQIVYGIGAVNILCFTGYRTAALLALGTVLIGFGYGASHSVIPAIISGCFGTDNFSSYFGITSLAAGIAGVCGPLLAGFVMDSSGSYLYAYLTGASCLAAASCVSGKIKYGK